MQYVVKTIKNAAIVSFCICAVITIVNWVPTTNFNLYKFVFSKGMLEGFMNGFFLYVGNTLAINRIKKVVPNDQFYLKRTILFVPINILLTITIIFCIKIVFYFFSENLTFTAFLSKQNTSYYINMICLSILVYITIYAFYFYKYYKENQLEKQAIIANDATAKFESLKNQIDPHFLFNSLNVLTALIEEDQSKAIEYTNSLSRIYRYILEQKDKKTVPVEQELDFAQNYINLLQLRFEDCIIYKIDNKDFQKNKFTIPLALQLLLENCIQHNKATEDQQLEINITIDDKYLVVSNNLQAKESKHNSTKIGLKNITERYQLLSKQQVEIINDNNYFTLNYPY